MKNPSQDSADAGALAGGAVAIAFTVLSADGGYDFEDLMIGVTLLLLLVAYLWDRGRTSIQSYAFSASAGLLAIPVAGSAVDLIFGARSFEGWPLLCVWLAVAALVRAVDSKYQISRPSDDATVQPKAAAIPANPSDDAALNQAEGGIPPIVAVPNAGVEREPESDPVRGEKN